MPRKQRCADEGNGDEWVLHFAAQWLKLIVAVRAVPLPPLEFTSQAYPQELAVPTVAQLATVMIFMCMDLSLGRPGC